MSSLSSFVTNNWQGNIGTNRYVNPETGLVDVSKCVQVPHGFSQQLCSTLQASINIGKNVLIEETDKNEEFRSRYVLKDGKALTDDTVKNILASLTSNDFVKADVNKDIRVSSSADKTPLVYIFTKSMELLYSRNNRSVGTVFVYIKLFIHKDSVRILSFHKLNERN